MSSYIDDFLPGVTVRKMFNSATEAGASVTLAVNGTVSVYKDGNTTQTTIGVTLSEDFDGLTGVHQLTVVTTDAFYTPGSDYEIVLSGSTIDGVTVNATLYSFSILNRSEPGLLVSGFAQVGSFDTIVLPAATSFASGTLNGATVVVMHGTGAGQSRSVDGFVGTTDTLSISPSLSPQLDTTSFVRVYATAPASTQSFPYVLLAPTTHTGAIIPQVTDVTGSVIATLTSAYDFAKGTVAMTESYAADGAEATPAQLLHMIFSWAQEKQIVGTTLTTKRLDGSTTSMTYTLNSATNPTSITRIS